MQKDIFISYSRRNLEQVKAIKALIEQQTGSECWMDLNGIESGSRMFTHDIVEAINMCRVFLFMLSAASQQSEFALRELNFAYIKARGTGKKVVIVNIDRCDMADDMLFMYSLTDTIDWNDAHQQEKFLRDLKNWSKAALQTSASADSSPQELYEVAQRLFRNNDKDAIHYLKAAAEMGYQPAEIALGTLHYTGTGLSQSSTAAARWMGEAAGNKVEPNPETP